MAWNYFIDRWKTSTSVQTRGELKRLTLAPRTTHWPPFHGLPYGLLCGLPYGLPPRTTLNKRRNLLWWRKERQEAYLLRLHDHNCIKTAAIFFSPTSSTQSFLSSPHSSCQSWTVEYLLFNLLQVFAIPFTLAKKQLFWSFLTLEKSRLSKNKPYGRSR